MPDADDLIEIEWLEPDSRAFGPSWSSPAARRRPPRARRTRPSWLRPAAITAIVVLVAGVAVWRPWQHEPTWRVLPGSPAVRPTLAASLVVPGLAESFQFSYGDGWDGEPVTAATGYVFAEAGGTREASRWARFSTIPSGDFAPVGDPGSPVVISGTPARLVTNGFGRITIDWGPAAGSRWGVDTNGLSEAQAIAFAKAVGVVDGQAAIRRDYDLGDLLPLGDLDTVNRLTGVLGALQGDVSNVMRSPTTLVYSDAGTRLELTSVQLPAAALPIAEFVLGAGAPVVVRGQPGLVIHRSTTTTVIAWVEGSRFVALAGNAPTEDMLQLAESVRPATTDEWLALTSPTGRPVDFSVVPFDGAEATSIGSGTTADGGAWLAQVVTVGDSATICFDRGGHSSDVCTTFTGSGYPTGAPLAELDGGQVQVFVAPVPTNAAVVVDTADEHMRYEYVPINDWLGAVAVFVPAGAHVGTVH